MCKTTGIPQAPLIPTTPTAPLLPLGAALLASSLSLLAGPSRAEEKTMATVEVTAQGNAPGPNASLLPRQTRIGKSEQPLLELPQSMTIQTEHLLDDRNYSDVRDALRATGGITFQSGETGEEDVRLRGFSLLQAGDVYIDGMRDPALYERDTFNDERLEVLKGSASMLFGRGSTGGVVNQVNKTPFDATAHEVKTLIGTGNETRTTGDFNFQTGEAQALRINVMKHDAGSYGTRLDKTGLAPGFAWGLGTSNEWFVGLYSLHYNNRPVYDAPWIAGSGSSGQIQTTLDPRKYYGLASDYNRGSADYGTVTHTFRGDPGTQWRTSFRYGNYSRDIWASVIQFRNRPSSVSAISDDTLLTRSQKGRVARSRIATLQSDYEQPFTALGLRHRLQAGVDLSTEDALRNNYFSGGNVTGPGYLTRVGTPDDGVLRMDSRGEPPFNAFNARTIGTYLQDTVEIRPGLSLIAGLRNDQFTAGYADPAGRTAGRSDSLWSPRLAALYQPTVTTAYHLSWGTSYNVSGDAYQYAVLGPTSRLAQTAPEQSVTTEIGAKFQLFDRRLLLASTIFHTEKYNERNTDPDTAATQELLSGQRHVTGLDLDFIGQINASWDVYGSWTWIPDAKVDASNVVARNSIAQGDRPGLTPVHTASLWSTYRINPAWRVGLGLNYRGPQTPSINKTVISREFTTLDLMAEYTVDRHASLKLNVNNATNESYADGLYNAFYTPGAPLTAQLSVKVMFD